jgi:hypothetical protein
MYQKYVDEKIFPPKPENSQELILTTNRFGKIDTDLGTVIYEDAKMFEEKASEKILQLSKSYEIGSPYILYKFMELLDKEKEKYICIQSSWRTNENYKPIIDTGLIGRN